MERTRSRSARASPRSLRSTARSRVSGFTILLVDVKDAVAARTLTYRPIPKLGANTVASNMVFLHDVRVPVERVLGEVDQGFAVLWDILNPERILAAAGGVGGAEAALRIACDYARERAPFGRPIGADQAVAFPLAKIKAQTEPARLMCDARIGKNIPVAEELVLAHIAQHELGLPRSY